VSLTYKRQRYFKSTLGGLVSLAIAVSLVIVFFLKIKTLLFYEGTINNTNLQRDDPSSDTDPLVFEGNKISLMVGIASIS